MKTGRVESRVGLKQGCVLSPILFALYIQDLEKELLQVDSGIRVGEAMVPGLFFADDMVLVASNEVRLQRLLEATVRFGEQRKMEFNGKKSKVMTNWRTAEGNKWQVGRQWVPEGEEYALTMEEADDYKYLGVRIQARGRRFDIQAREIIKKARQLKGYVGTEMKESCNQMLVGRLAWEHIA